MRLKRFIKSLINSFLFIINAILWIFKINSIGEMATKIQTGKGRKQNFIYGMFSLVQSFSYLCIIGLVFTIYWWYKDETSIAEKLSGLKMQTIISAPVSKPEPATTMQENPKTSASDNINTSSQNSNTFQEQPK